MTDFTLSAYRQYLTAIYLSGTPFYRFDEFIELPVKPQYFCLLRHDVDRRPIHALRMAQLEAEMNIKATYYFRTKKNVFDIDIIKQISALGHEIGYHYESLSDSNGDIGEAIKDFEINLQKLRKIVTVKTVSMHGRPFKPYDNRDIWRPAENHRLLVEKYGILGEVYLDIDYTDIAYVNDTGRNWTSTEANVRDKVHSRIKADFESGEQLLQFLSARGPKKMIFQIHPERWSYSTASYLYSFAHDFIVNKVKAVLRLRGMLSPQIRME